MNSAEALVSNRLRGWALDCGEKLKESIRAYAFARGLTSYDVEDMWSMLVGAPRPIYVEPEPEITFDDLVDLDDPAEPGDHESDEELDTDEDLDADDLEAQELEEY